MVVVVVYARKNLSPDSSTGNKDPLAWRRASGRISLYVYIIIHTNSKVMSVYTKGRGGLLKTVYPQPNTLPWGATLYQARALLELG